MNTPRKLLSLAVLGLALPLAGCLTAKPPLTFDLQSLQQVESVRRASSRMIVLTEPRVIQTYDTNRVVVRDVGGVLSYLPDAQWSDRLPALVQTRVLQSFEDAGFPNIGRPTDQLNPQVALILDIRAFEVDATTGMATVTIAGRLLDDRNRRILATRSFTASVPLQSLAAGGAVQGLNAALQNVTQQIMVWTAANG